MEREAVVWNCLFLDALKGTVLHRTVPRDRVNRKLEVWQDEAIFQSVKNNGLFLRRGHGERKF